MTEKQHTTYNKQQWRHVTSLLYSICHVNPNLDSLYIRIWICLIKCGKTIQFVCIKYLMLNLHAVKFLKVL